MTTTDSPVQPTLTVHVQLSPFIRVMGLVLIMTVVETAIYLLTLHKTHQWSSFWLATCVAWMVASVVCFVWSIIGIIKDARAFPDCVDTQAPASPDTSTMYEPLRSSVPSTFDPHVPNYGTRSAGEFAAMFKRGTKDS